MGGQQTYDAWRAPLDHRVSKAAIVPLIKTFGVPGRRDRNADAANLPPHHAVGSVLGNAHVVDIE